MAFARFEADSGRSFRYFERKVRFGAGSANLAEISSAMPLYHRSFTHFSGKLFR